jgi:Transposase domain (DUF772)
VNLAYRWFCKLGIQDAVPDHSAFSRARNERFREGDVFRRVFVDASFSRQRDKEERAAAGLRHRWIFAVARGLILIGLGSVLLQRGFGGSTAPIMPSVTTAAHEQISTELLETTKGLQITQQQAVDQLHIVQGQLIAQRAGDFVTAGYLSLQYSTKS